MRFFFYKYDIVKAISFWKFFFSMFSFSPLKKSLKRIVVHYAVLLQKFVYTTLGRVACISI
ncbi:hypothetical protein B0A67_17350 [Flavobacterium aquidurense]|uniref:hypothetical protein n=1 Tax=Flavobacterium aquidurense TaxID=362413 RepID=UPI0009335E41|nr:hypothetical protein [Flavobacterium aquidurense]OXA70079.1 hypothetical protein B0A67_17350 [Flavobacterium aquidurense]